VCLAALLQWLDQRFITVYPTPDRKSTFFDAYELDPALTPVTSPRFVAGGGGFSESGGGHFAAHLKRELNETFALHGKDPRQLMELLREDIYTHLEQSQVQIVSVAGNEIDGYRFSYRQRQGSGVVALAPIEIVDPYQVRARTVAHPNQRLQELAADELPVKVTIRIDETWPRS
jgi:hypothetical protein